MNIENIELFQQCGAVICDLDGTLYLENTPIDGAFEFLEKVQAAGKKLYYFTNNTSRSRVTYLEKLEKIGFPINDDMMITSADCADSYLRRHNLFPEIYLVGNKDLASDFQKRGYICLTDEQAYANAPKAVVMGFDTELTYRKIHTCYDLILQKGMPFIATHADKLCPVTKTTFKPDVGSFISMFETATDGITPTVVGKPTQEAVNAISERAGFPPEKIAFLGDRLYTDIRMAMHFNMIGVMVFSGETTSEMYEASPDRAKIVVDSVKDLIAYL